MGGEGDHSLAAAVVVDPAQPTKATIPDQPASALPPRAEPAEPPAPTQILAQPEEPPSAQVAPSPSRTEQALDLWSTTDLTIEAIAERVGCVTGSVMAFVYAARKKNDPRGFARKAAHDDKLSSPPALKPDTPKPAVSKRALRTANDPQPTIAGIARAVSKKSFAPPTEAPPPPSVERLIGIVIDKPGAVVALDMTNFVVAAPGGDWQVTRPVARIMERMRDGGLFDHQTLADIGPMNIESFMAAIPRWQESLAKIGVEFLSMKAAGCKIRIAGA